MSKKKVIPAPTLYASVAWTVEDVLSLNEGRDTKISREQAEELLKTCESKLQARMVDKGWELLDYAISDYLRGR